MKVLSLILSIVCAVLFGICAVISTNTIAEIIYVFCSVMWGMISGLRLADLLLK